MGNQVRALAICLFRRGERILVAEGYDPVKQETFYRPLGGGIEFGETGVQTIRRELQEEIGAEVADVRYLFTFENIYVFNGKPGHEIAMVYDGRLVNESLYEREQIEGQELDETWGMSFHAVWKELSEFGEGKDILYPEKLLEALGSG